MYTLKWIATSSSPSWCWIKIYMSRWLQHACNCTQNGINILIAQIKTDAVTEKEKLKLLLSFMNFVKAFLSSMILPKKFKLHWKMYGTLSSSKCTLSQSNFHLNPPRILFTELLQFKNWFCSFFFQFYTLFIYLRILKINKFYFNLVINLFFILNIFR